MTPIAEILKPGLATTIQDIGRPGVRHLGVPLSGAADPVSLGLANAAAGNSSQAAALECTLSGPVIKFLRKTTFALGGADMNAQFNGEDITPYSPINADAGDQLVLGAAKSGARAYIAFTGGLSGDAFLDSVSTYAPAGFGGLNGRALLQGDILYSANLPAQSPREIPMAFRPRFTHDFILRTLPGPEADVIIPDAPDIFFSAKWTIGRRANRMGVLLDGPRLSLVTSPPMASSPVFPGTVQCPPDGAPFLLLCDAQTVGGYPRIAQVVAADLPLAGQMRSGDHVWFRKTTAADARDIAVKKSALFEEFLPVGFF